MIRMIAVAVVVSQLSSATTYAAAAASSDSTIGVNDSSNNNSNNSSNSDNDDKHLLQKIATLLWDRWSNSLQFFFWQDSNDGDNNNHAYWSATTRGVLNMITTRLDQVDEYLVHHMEKSWLVVFRSTTSSSNHYRIIGKGRGLVALAIVLLCLLVLVWYVVQRQRKKYQQRIIMLRRSLARRPSMQFAVQQQEQQRMRSRSASLESITAAAVSSPPAAAAGGGSGGGGFFSSTSLQLLSRPRSRSRSSSELSISQRRRRFRQGFTQESSSDLFRDLDIAEDANVASDEQFLQALDFEQRRREEALLLSPRARPRSKEKQLKRSKNMASSASILRLRGPGYSSIHYDTISPPPTFAEASRNLIKAETEWRLKKTVSLHLLAGDQNNPLSINNINHRKVGTAALLIQERDLQKDGAAAFKRENSYIRRSTAFRRPVTDCSVHVCRPVEGGVLQLYVQGATRNEWMEHTFASAEAAAQFQLDLLALQTLGPIIHNMYQAFAILHQGSDAFLGDEAVLHHQHGSSKKEAGEGGGAGIGEGEKADEKPVISRDSGIAWDDVMRCFGSSFPSIQLRLEAIWWMEVHGSESLDFSQRGNKKIGDSEEGTIIQKASASDPGVELGGESLLMPRYASKKRLLLGPVDFFRLFVPKLPETAVPEGESTRMRMEQMLRSRKRVARASVLVQNYSRARVVANKGWDLDPSVTLPDNYISRRLAFDDNEDNKQHDDSAKNEYYEATVSRDVVCRVRGSGFLNYNYTWWKCGLDKTPAAMSLYQGYTLVGIHAFQWPGDNESLPLHYRKDPVKCIPSLCSLIASNPDLHFFVYGFFLEEQKASIIHIFCRSLPKGVDPNFDSCVDRFIHGTEVLRRRKLEVILQLAIDSERLSLFGRFLLWWFSFLLRLTFRRQTHVPQPAVTSDRKSVPAVNLSNCGETFHFGGILQTDRTLPQNYVASTMHMKSKRNNNFETRMLLSYIEFGGLSRNVTDVSFVLTGEREDELPERVLCTSRIVRYTLRTLPLSSVSLKKGDEALELTSIDPPERTGGGAASLYFRIFVTDPIVAVVSSLIRSKTLLQRTAGAGSENSPIATLLTQTPKTKAGVVFASGTVDQAINELVRILEDIKVPIRVRSNHSPGTLMPYQPQHEDLAQISILRTVSRSDIQRYLVASNCSLKTAAKHLVDSAVWRGLTFPIDTRTCRVELQSGQFFQQGTDFEGNPIFYFRSMNLGPWRKDEDAAIAAVLHRLESSLRELSKKNPCVQCTLIVLMGKPYRKKSQSNSDVVSTEAAKKHLPKSKEDRTEQATVASTAALTADRDGEDSYECDEEDEIDDSTVFEEAIRRGQRNNPRIQSDELWNVHTSKRLIERLAALVLTHYPERLSKALVVIGHGNRTYIRSTVGGVLAVASLIPYSRTRDKVRILRRYRDLLTYADRSQLITLVGGTQVEDWQHYECN